MEPTLARLTEACRLAARTGLPVYLAIPGCDDVTVVIEPHKSREHPPDLPANVTRLHQRPGVRGV